MTAYLPAVPILTLPPPTKKQQQQTNKTKIFTMCPYFTKICLECPY